MCQSKSDGGIRCDSHAKKAVAEHQSAYNGLVQQECEARGISIDPSCYILTSDEKANVRAQVNADPKVEKARIEAQRASSKFNRVKGTLIEALKTGDVNRLATVIRQHSPEMQAITEANEARKQQLAADLASATDENWKNEVRANDKKEIAMLDQRKQNLNRVSKNAAVDVNNTYGRTRDVAYSLKNLPCVQQADEEYRAARENERNVTAKVRERIERAVVANKMVNDPKFQEVESSSAFRSSPEVHKWNAKHRELTENYRMTNTYQKQVADKISVYKRSGMDTAEMEAAYRALTVRKAKFVYKNVVETHGLGSPEAQAARAAYVEAKTKELVF